MIFTRAFVPASNLALPFFFDHSMDPSNGRFMLMHLRPSRVGTRMHCLVARSLNIVDSQLGIGMENCNVGADNVAQSGYG